MATAAKQAKAATDDFPPSRAAWYTVGMLALFNALDNIDRGIISLLIEPIKRDLDLSDTEISLLVGLAFSLFYALIGLPMSRLADIGTRKTILTAGLSVWSLATAFAAFAQSFTALFIARGMVGAGESVKGPSALSMIADLVPRSKIPRAMSLYSLGISLGKGASLIIGGVLIAVLGGKVFALPFGFELADWQMVFLLVGLPGLLVAAIFHLTVEEPVRRGRQSKEKLPVSAIFHFLAADRAIYIPLLLGLALLQIEAIGLLSWRVPFYQRSFGWGPGMAGPLLGTIALTVTPIGLAFGAVLGERMTGRGDPGALIKLAAWSSGGSLLFGIAQLLMPTPWLSIACVCGSYLCTGVASPTYIGAIQMVTPNEFRGQVNALYLFMISVVGTAIGPITVALVTDYLFGDDAMLRYSMVIVAIVFGVSAIGLLLAGIKPYTARMAERIAAEQEAG